jgi:hypothetical protein
MHGLFVFALLAQAVTPGEKSGVTIESTLELDIVVRDGNGETTRLLNLTKKEKYAQESIDARSLRIKCISSTTQKSGTDTPLEEKSTAMAGQTFVASRSDAGWTVRGSDDALPVEAQGLGAWNDVSRLLPAQGSLSTGAKWTVEAKDLLPLFYPAALREGSGKMECSCESASGGKASIIFKGMLSGKGRVESTSLVALTVTTGRLTWDMVKGRPVSLTISGSIQTVTDMIDMVRKPGTGENIGNEEERRKVGEVNVKSRKLETVIKFE